MSPSLPRLLRSDRDRRYRGAMAYLVAYDHEAGSPERYTVYVLSSGDPVTVGRELDLLTARGVIADLERHVRLACPDGFFGDRSDVLRVARAVQAARRERYGA